MSTGAVGFYTLAVGHGLCQVLLLPRRRAVLFDGGPSAARQVGIEFLERYVDTILAYVATHSDQDHIGAAIAILSHEKYQSADRFRVAFFSPDRQTQGAPALWRYLSARRKANTLGDLRLGYVDGDRPKVVMRQPEVTVSVLFPKAEHCLANLFQKTTAVQRNRAGKVVRIQVGKCRILVLGDTDVVALNLVAASLGFDLTADVVSVPHHGGQVPGPKDGWSGLVKRMRPTIALVSSGRGTTVRHETLMPFVREGCVVQCTELTQACHPNIDSFAPSVSSIRKLPSRVGGSYNGIGCAETIVVTVSNDCARVLGGDSHRNAVKDRVAFGGTPLCLGVG